MWHPASSLSSRVHSSHLWHATEAQLKADEGARGAAGTELVRDASFDLRPSTPGVPALGGALRGTTPLLASQQSPFFVSRPLSLDLSTPSTLLREEARLKKIEGARAHKLRRAADRAQRREVADRLRDKETAERPASTPTGLIASPVQRCPSPPSSAPLGAMRPGTASLGSAAAAANSVAASSDHFPPSPFGGSSRPPSRPSGPPRDLTAPTVPTIAQHLAMNASASPNAQTNFMMALSQRERKEIYQARFDKTVWGMLDQDGRPVNDVVAASIARCGPVGHLSTAQMEEQRLFNAEKYWQLIQQQNATEDSLHYATNEPAAPLTSRPHTGGVQRPTPSGSLSARAAPPPKLQLRTSLQQFQFDIAPPSPRPSTSQGRSFASADLKAAPPAPPAARSSLVAPTTSAMHWSNRIYSRATAMTPRQRRMHETTTAQSDQIARRFDSFRHDVRTKDSPTNVAKKASSPIPPAPTHATISTAPILAPPSQIRRDKRYAESEARFLVDFDHQLQTEFSALVSDARFQAHAATTHSEMGRQQLQLVAGELTKRSVPPVHDMVHQLKVQTLGDAQAARARLDRKRDKVMRRHWKTGQMMEREVNVATTTTRVPSAAAARKDHHDEKDAHTEPNHPEALAARHAQHVQHFLDQARAEEEKEARKKYARSESLSRAGEADHPTAAQVEPSTTVVSEETSEAPLDPQTHLGRFDLHLRAVVSTDAYLSQSMSDAHQPAAQQALVDEVTANSRKAAEKQQAKRERHSRRRGDFGSLAFSDEDMAAHIASLTTKEEAESSSDSAPSDSDERAAPLSPRGVASVRAAAQREVQPMVELLAQHHAAEHALSLIDATKARMREQAAYRIANEQAERVMSREQHAREAAREHELEMAALKRHEMNQAALRATRRSMARTGELQLNLMAASGLTQVVPQGYLARFEIRLSYSAPSLPMLVARTLPFAPSTTSIVSPDLTELLQCVRLPVVNAHVQKVRVELQVFTPKQLLRWLFAHRLELFGPNAGVGALRTGGRDPVDYLKHCQQEVLNQSLSTRVSRPASGARLLPATRPQSSQALVLHATAPKPLNTALARSTTRAKSGGPVRTDAQHFIAAYQEGLDSWFRQGSSTPSAPSTQLQTRAQQAPSPSLSTSHREQVMIGHIIDEANTETFNGWLGSMRGKLTAYNSYVARVNAGEDMTAYAEDGSLRDSVGEAMDAASRRRHVMSTWSSEQVSVFLDQIGLDDTTIFKRRVLGGPEFVASKEELERMALTAGVAQDQTIQVLANRQRHAGVRSISPGRRESVSRAPPIGHDELTAENKQRSADALRLLRAFQLLRGEAPTPSVAFDFTAISQLRQLVFEAFHSTTNMPEYVAAAEAAERNAAALATTKSLSPEETQKLSLRLIAHKSRMAEREAKMNERESQAGSTTAGDTRATSRVTEPSFSTGASRAQRRNDKQHVVLRLRDTLLTMDNVPPHVAAKWRDTHEADKKLPSRVEVEDGANDSFDSDDDGIHDRAPSTQKQSLVPRRASAGHSTAVSITSGPVGMFQSRPASSSSAVRAPVGGAFSSSTAVCPRAEDEVRVVGWFSLPVRRVARGTEGWLRESFGLRPPIASTQETTEQAHAHYRNDLTTTMHSRAARTFLAASGAAAPMPAPLSTSDSPAAPHRAYTPFGARLHLRDEAEGAIARQAREALEATRVEVHARFVPSKDAGHEEYKA